ncbi:ATP-dependent DNA ligase [Rhizobium sp. P32RR-XVIII]|nr:ATP-dependent DNA ligase [Rhizobium sp. P32RR-XVIII]
MSGTPKPSILRGPRATSTIRSIRIDLPRKRMVSRRYRQEERDAVYVKPILIAEIEYRAWTHDGKLRHASYKGLREEQDEAAIYEIE